MNLRFRQKLYFVFSVVIIFAVVSLSLYIHMHIFRQVEEETMYNDRQLCIKISENVDTYIEKLDDITKKLISDPDLLQIMREIGKGNVPVSDYDRLKQDRVVAGIVSNAITLTSFPHVNVYLYDRDGTYSFVYNQADSNFDEIMLDEDNAADLDNKRLVIFADKDIEGDREPSLSFMRAIFDVSANRYGYIEVQSDYKKLDEICDIAQVGNVLIEDKSGQIIYPSGKAPEDTGEILTGGKTDEKSGMFREGEHIYFYDESDYTGLTTYIQYPVDTVYSSLDLLQRTTFLFFAFITAAAILMVVVFSRMLVRPLQELRDSVLKVTYENMGLTFDTVYNNEIAELKDAFQSILDDLKKSAEQEIASSQAEARARIAALQAQISPHFIHNVLYSISISAKEGRTDDAAAMCKQLSDMLRYTVNLNAHSVSLDAEIECISNYLALQEKYYEDFLEYEICIGPEMMQTDIPRLSILPFVENAVHHGFEGKKPPYRIRIEGRMTGDLREIRICDNGGGFDEEKIRELKERADRGNMELEAENRGEGAGLGGLGILNCVFRLKMFLGESFSFDIENNEKEEGASIYLRWQRGEDDV